MKFFILSTLVAVAVAKTPAPVKSYAPTYSCPKGYSLSGSSCTKTVSAPHQTQTVSSSNSVAAEKYCPKGSQMNGKACSTQSVSAKVAETTSTQVPSTFCPKGSNGPNANGMCEQTTSVQSPVVKNRDVNSQQTEVQKTPYTVTVSKQVSVAGSPKCPSGSKDEGGVCTVSSSTTDYFTVDQDTTVSIPVNSASESTVCPSGTRDNGSGCVASLSSQSVEQSSSAKTVRVAKLATKTASYNLPATELVSNDVCPQGSTAQADGSCTVTLTRSSLEQYDVPVSSQVPQVNSVPQTLRLARTSLVASYSCPKGTTSSGSGESLTCTVTLPSGAPTTRSQTRTVRVARLEKRPVTVTVNRVESVPVDYCPTGTTENSNGECEVTVSVRQPVTNTDSKTVCPPGSEEYHGGSKSAKCKKSVTVTVPATELPSDSKKSGVRYSCPKGTNPIGEGPGTVCATETYEEVPYETLTTQSVSYESSTVTETVPKLYRYETRTVSEEANTEEVYTVYDEQELEETSAAVESSTYTETVPALVSYSVSTDYDQVTVHNDRVSYGQCIDASSDDSCSTAGVNGSNACCLVETKHRVVSEQYTQTVARVSTYSVKSTSETVDVNEDYQTYEQSELSETSHSVSTSSHEQTVGPNTLVKYRTSSEPTTVTLKKISSSTRSLSETVPSVPTYSTQTVTEEASSERVSTTNTPGVLSESYIAYETTVVTNEVAPTTTYRTEYNTVYTCPAGTSDNGSSCVSTQTVQAQYKCPAGSTQTKHGECQTTSYSTVKSCPAGYTDNGKSCTKTESIPATASTPAPKKSAPAPSKKSYTAPTPTYSKKDYSAPSYSKKGY